MQMLARKPADAYRKVDLEARIEAASGSELTLICLEEAVDALGRALLALERRPGMSPVEAIERAQSIALFLGRSVAPDNPMRETMMQFYGGLAARLSRNIARADKADIARMREDFADLLGALGAA